MLHCTTSTARTPTFSSSTPAARKDAAGAKNRPPATVRSAGSASREARDDGDHAVHGTSFWLASEEYQRLYQETLDLISDARQAAQRAYERALEQEQEARAALEEAQANVIVLPDGRRVYFTADGKRLYTEDDQQITDAATIAEAQRRRTDNSTTYEDFTARRDERTRAAQEVEDLRTAIRRLDDLERRMERDDLTPEELAQIRQETQDIVATLPPEARADYERMQSAKSGESEPMHRDADPAFAAAPNVNAEFQAARAATATQLSEDAAPPDDAPARKPLYRSAPGFE